MTHLKARRNQLKEVTLNLALHCEHETKKPLRCGHSVNSRSHTVLSLQSQLGRSFVTNSTCNVSRSVGGDLHGNARLNRPSSVPHSIKHSKSSSKGFPFNCQTLEIWRDERKQENNNREHAEGHVPGTVETCAYIIFKYTNIVNCASHRQLPNVG